MFPKRYGGPIWTPNGPQTAALATLDPVLALVLRKNTSLGPRSIRALEFHVPRARGRSLGDRFSSWHEEFPSPNMRNGPRRYQSPPTPSGSNVIRACRRPRGDALRARE